MVSTDLVVVGRHDFGLDDPEWDRVNTLGASPIMAFSRTPLEAFFGRESPVVLTGAVAATPPAHSEYARLPRSSRGHSVVWCQFTDPEALAHAVARLRPAAADEPRDPFGRSAVPAPPLAGTLAWRAARAALDTPELCDPIELDEAVALVADLLIGSLTGPDIKLPNAPSPGARHAVNTAAETIAHQFSDPPSLGALARRCGVSPAYLSRAFRQQTGVTLSTYSALIRLSEAAELLRDARCDVTRAAYACGFSSHAHLTSTCRRRLGVTPSSIAAAHREELAAMISLVRTRRAGD